MVGVGSWVAHNWAVAMRVDGLMGGFIEGELPKRGGLEKINGV